MIKNDIKVLVLDLDNTLLKDDKSISPKDIEALKKCIKKGIEVIIASGRFTFSHKDIVKRLGLDLEDQIHIADGGGTIYQKDDKRSINFIRPDDIQEIYSYIKENNFIPFVTDGEFIYYEQEGPLNKTYKELIRQKPELFKKVNDLRKIKDIQKFILYIDDDHSFNILKKIENPNIKTFISAKNLAEITSKELDKWNALEEILKDKDISRENICSIGDSGNDLELIKNSGLGLAVNNALEEVKEVADYISVNDNNNSAVSELIEKYILDHE